MPLIGAEGIDRNRNSNLWTRTALSHSTLSGHSRTYAYHLVRYGRRVSVPAPGTRAGSTARARRQARADVPVSPSFPSPLNIARRHGFSTLPLPSSTPSAPPLCTPSVAHPNHTRSLTIATALSRFAASALLGKFSSVGTPCSVLPTGCGHSVSKSHCISISPPVSNTFAPRDYAMKRAWRCPVIITGFATHLRDWQR